METLLYNRLQSFCHASNFLAKSQFGFRKHSNTELAALSLHVKVLPAFEEKKMQYISLIMGNNVIMNSWVNILKLIFDHTLVEYMVLHAYNILKSFLIHACSRNLHKHRPDPVKLSGAYEAKAPLIFFPYCTSRFLCPPVSIFPPYIMCTSLERTRFDMLASPKLVAICRTVSIYWPHCMSWLEH